MARVTPIVILLRAIIAGGFLGGHVQGALLGGPGRGDVLARAAGFFRDLLAVLAVGCAIPNT